MMMLTSILVRHLQAQEQQFFIPGIDFSSPFRDWWSGSTPIYRFSTPPVNDNFANALPLTLSSNVVYASNIGATVEANEPQDPSQPGKRSVGYSWTVQASVSTHVAYYLPAILPPMVENVVYPAS